MSSHAAELGFETQAKGFLNYNKNTRLEKIQNFYRLNHINQTMTYVQHCKKTVLKLEKTSMDIWTALQMLDEIIDDSDPDTDLTQLDHAYQTAEGIRKAFPNMDWLHLVGLIHDCGKFLCHPRGYNLPSWTAHGDSFIVGAQWADSCVYHHFFAENPDTHDPRYNTELGIYKANCGFDNCYMSFGHDEYLYHVLRGNCKLPDEALYLIRYHSFHPFHYWGDYMYLASEYDLKQLPLLKSFAKYDLYTKRSEKPNRAELESYYRELVDKYCPGIFNF